jgi:hypothetical protein
MKLHNLMSYAMAVAICGAAMTASAGTIQIDLTGVNLNYSAGSATLVDAGAPVDPLNNITITEDAVQVAGSPLSGAGTALDLSISGISAIPAAGGMGVSAPGGVLELFGPGGVSILDLTLDAVDVIYTPLTAGTFRLNFLFGAGSGAINSQAIPGISGPILDPVNVSFNLQGSVTTAGGFLTSFTGSGTGSLSATTVPEPSTIAMIGLGGLMSLMVYSRYRLG